MAIINVIENRKLAKLFLQVIKVIAIKRYIQLRQSRTPARAFDILKVLDQRRAMLKSRTKRGRPAIQACLTLITIAISTPINCLYNQYKCSSLYSISQERFQLKKRSGTVVQAKFFRCINTFFTPQTPKPTAPTPP